MWNTEAKQCSQEWAGPDYCKSFPDCRGWGCQLIRIRPDKLPATERDRGKLFSKVYAQAEIIGVLDCPHYRQAIIDEVVENPSELTELMNHFDE